MKKLIIMAAIAVFVAMSAAWNASFAQSISGNQEIPSLLNAARLVCSYILCDDFVDNNESVISKTPQIDPLRVIGKSLGIPVPFENCYDYYNTGNPIKAFQDAVGGDLQSYHVSGEVCPNVRHAILLATDNRGLKTYLLYSVIKGKTMFHTAGNCPEFKYDKKGFCTVRFFPEQTTEYSISTARGVYFKDY